MDVNKDARGATQPPGRQGDCHPRVTELVNDTFL